MEKKSLFLAIGLMTIMSSCATMFTGTKSKVNITSVPAGARILVDGIDRGTTPSIVKLKRGFSSQDITLKKEGFKDKTFEPEQSFQCISILNLASILGWGIDALSGAIMKYDPKFYEIPLDPISSYVCNVN